VIDQIKAAIQSAADTNQKTAMFHLQVLLNADELMGIDPKGFCKEVSVSAAYATEFTKMLALARLMNEQGITLERLTLPSECVSLNRPGLGEV